jgi:hypothetical protein
MNARIALNSIIQLFLSSLVEIFKEILILTQSKSRIYSTRSGSVQNERENIYIKKNFP